MRQIFTLVLLLLTLTRFSGAQIQTSSNLPIILIEADDISDELRVVGSMKIIYKGEGERNYLTDANNPAYLNYNGLIDIEIRGRSTQEFSQKKQYGFSTKNMDLTNNNVSLLGMPAEHDWILNGMAFDRSLLRDYLAFDLSRKIGEYAPRSVYCEVSFNGGPLGLYLLTEKIKADDNRVNIIKIGTLDVLLPKLSGGYITKAEYDSPYAWIMQTWHGSQVLYCHYLPKPEDINASQDSYIHDVFNNLDAAAMEGKVSISDGFPSIIDIPSFIHYMIIEELTLNDDAYDNSTFFHKDRNGKLRAGPVWDFDLAFGSGVAFHLENVTIGDDTLKTDGWELYDEYRGGSRFWKALFDNPLFRCYFSKRWNELIQPGQALNFAVLESFIDQTVTTIDEAVVREYANWEYPDNHQERILHIKNFLKERIKWMTDNLGLYSSCCDVAVPPLVITKIMYHPGVSIYSSYDDDLEFLEITNNSDKTADLTGVYFGGTGFVYQFPVNTILGPHQTVFLASNSTYFQSEYGFVPYGQFTRHLSNKGENLVLLDAFGNFIDNVHYSDSIPWPDADGNGYYLDLPDIKLDNSLPSSWEASKEAINREAYLHVSAESMSLGYQEGSTGTLDIGSNTSWTISSSETWLTISNANGFGNTTVTVTTQKNPSIHTRNDSVIIKAAGLPDKTVIITQSGSPTGISDTENNYIKIYPNPANTVLFIEGLSGDTQVSIYDLKGNLILKKQLFEDNIDIRTLASGVYTIKLEDITQSITRKFVKN